MSTPLCQPNSMIFGRMDDYVFVPEELFKHLPQDIVRLFHARKEEGEKLLKIADRDIQALIRLMNAIPTTASLTYIFHRLRMTKFTVTNESWMEQEV